MRTLDLARRLRADSPTLYRDCMALSLAAHGLLLAAAGRWGSSAYLPSGKVEVDLTTTLIGGPAKLGAPKARTKAPRPAGPAQLSAPVAASAPEVSVSAPPPTSVAGSAAQPVSGAGTPDGTQVAAPAGGSPQGTATRPTAGGVEGGTGVSPLPGGSGRGAAFGTPDGDGEGGGDIRIWPRLLNLDEILRDLRRFYPEEERRAGREGRVLLAVHIQADGSVSGADVLESGGERFDSAARSVAGLMRFSPAQGPAGPVAVRLRQAVEFRLEN